MSRVSIVVRTKDRPLLLERALTSISAQSMADWECIIVNDGGQTLDVERAVSALGHDAAKRVQVISHAKSLGRWASANAGVLHAASPLIVLHDDDDTWHPDFLLRACDYLDEHPARVGAVSRIEIVWETWTGSGYHATSRERFQPYLEAPALADTLLYNRFVPLSFVYRRSLHDDLGLYDETLPVIGDWEFYLRVLARYELEYLDDTCYAHWHQRATTTGHDGNSVIEAGADHALNDKRIRDAALRDYVDREGLGLPLYLSKFIDQRFVDVENGLRSALQELTIRAQVNRAAARFLTRLSTAPRHVGVNLKRAQTAIARRSHR